MSNMKKPFKIVIAISATVIAVALAVLLTITVVIPAIKYNKATDLMNNGEYVSASLEFAALEDYKDADEQKLLCNYKEAERLESVGRKAAAAMAFGALGDYSDARERSFALWDNIAVRETFKAGYFEGMAIKEDGTVSRFNYEPNQRVMREFHAEEQYGTNVVDIELGSYTPVALRSDGTLSESNYEWTDVVAIDSSYKNFAALKSDGTVLHQKTYDARDYGQGNVSGWRNIVAVECSDTCTVGLRSNGTVITAGKNDNGECDVEDWTDIVAVSADNYIVGLKADGTVVTTNSEADLSSWTDIVYISTDSDCILGIKADGTVLHIGNSEHNICLNWKNISAINCSGILSTVYGITKNGELAYDAEMKAPLGQKINCSAIKDWTGIKQPKVIGFYDFDHEIQIDVEAEKNLEASIENRPFNNKFGTSSTLCAKPGCDAFIARSGDTNCCEVHSNRCGNCYCYIDGDAMYCMSCIENALS